MNLTTSLNMSKVPVKSCLPFGNCCIEDHTNKSSYTLKDPKGKGHTQYIFSNVKKSPISTFTIDGCLIPQNQLLRCDALLLDHHGRAAYFLEFKGSDISKAIDQLAASINQLKQQLNNHQLHARAILTKSPPVNARVPKYVKFATNCKESGGSFKSGSRQLQDSN